MQASTFRRWLPWILKLGVSISLIWYLLGKVGLEGAWSRAQAIPLVMMASAAALLTLQAFLWGVRWSVVVHAMGKRFPVRHSIPITFVGLFFNQFLPASVGADAVRMWQSQRAGLPVSTAVNAVLLERAGSLLTVSMLAAVTSPYWAEILGSRLAAWVFPLITLAGIGGIAVLASVARLPRHWFERRRALRGLVYLSEDARKVFFNVRNVTALTVLAVLGQALLATSVFALAEGLGAGVTLFQCFVLMPPVVVISAMPISVAGWGVRELVMITGLGFMGVQAETALLLSVVLAALVVLISLPGGLLWLFHRTPRTMREIKANRTVEP
jgi:uncharacterized protein (TIRG00374 family)